MGAAASGAAGQGIGLAKDIFGSKTTQDTSGHQQAVYRPQDEAAMRNQAHAYGTQTGTYQQLLGQLRDQASVASPQLNTGFSGNLQGFNTQFNAPQFQNGLDATSQALISQAQQERAGQLGAQQAGLRGSMRNNPVLASLLGAQLGQQAQLNNNPLQFQAQQSQDARQIGRAQAQNEALGLGNQALLQQGQYGQQAQQLGNQALGQQFQLGQSARGEQAGYQGQSQQAGADLFNLLSQLGQSFATTHSGQSSSGRSGGLF